MRSSSFGREGDRLAAIGRQKVKVMIYQAVDVRIAAADSSIGWRRMQVSSGLLVEYRHWNSWQRESHIHRQI